MKARCTACQREYEVSADAPPGNCVSCGGRLQPATDAPPSVAPQQAPLELAGESPQAGQTCPNCGKWIEPGAKICTACGYSPRLARTLTTRIGTPEMLKPKSKKNQEPDAPEIDAEQKYRREKARSSIGRFDSLRLFIAIFALAALALMVIAAPAGLPGLTPLKLPPLLRPPKFDALNATFMMLLFLAVAIPITAIGVRIAAAMSNTEITSHFNWLRTAGALAAALLAMELGYTIDQSTLHLPTLLLLPSLATVGALTLLVFTWYLHDVNFTNAILLALATLVSAAVVIFAATAAFGWLANIIGFDPVIRVHNLFFL